ncbi:MAG: periplasmic divalent cation tolerance protein [Verrucomicrobiota bacterium]|jgi:periplasmic divalent cation tolerance protein
MAGQVLLAFSTFPDQEIARKVARELVDLRLAACGNILPQIHSIYRWEGKVQSGDETLVLFKLDAQQYSEFEEKLRALHPYDVPEIIAVPVAVGLPAYLAWVAENCGS